MDNELWAEALNEISDKHIEEAANPKKKHKITWFGAVASTLAAAMLVVILSPLAFLALFFQGAGSAEPPNDFTGAPTGSTDIPFGSTQATTLTPDMPDALFFAAPARNQTVPGINTARSLVLSTKAQRGAFFRESTRLVLTAAEGNALWSPVNAYMALVMTTQLSAGETQQELLDALGAADMDALTAQAAAIWETIHHNGEYEKCLLANSIWLDEALHFNPDPLDRLSYELYTSVYREDLGTPEANLAIQDWVNANTGNLLTDAASGIDLPEETVLALYSTIYYQTRWYSEFSPGNTAKGFFHAPDGDVVCDFMKKSQHPMHYCWGDNFGAVSLALDNGSSMWFILPDEGISVDQILAEGDYMTMVTSGYDYTVGDYNWRDYTQIKVNLSVPKFDISAQVKLDEILGQMGIQTAFDPEEADFSEIFSGRAVWLEGVNQAVRVAIDEEGVTAAAYTEIQAPGAAPPPEEIMDFVLDRPFLFVITKEDIPLFAGIVNEP